VNVVPLAADSLGVRSVATYVECGETRIVIDPGASLGKSRFNLPPADEEWEALRRANDRIAGYAARASIVFVSHYHEDHFRYDPGIYRDKTVWAKDPKRLLGPAQHGRAAKLWQELGDECRIDSAEGRRIETRDAVLTASPPLSHGPDGTDLGYVVALTVADRREGARFVHASDVQGPLSPVATAYLIRERPTLLYLSGPPAYLERDLGAEAIDRGAANLMRILDATGCRVIMDHHAVRDAQYRERFRALWDTGRVVTAAAFLGLPDAALESARLDLWKRRRKPPARVEPAPRGRVVRGLRGGSPMLDGRTPRRLRRTAGGAD
jgi:predicted metallo-beta-lactamase superfamily hydrolase